MMASDDTSSITYRAGLPLSWEHAAPPPAMTLAFWRHSNLALLRALATIESVAATDKEHDAEPATAKVLERLEAKLDVALGLLARLTTSQTELPPSSPVTLAIGKIEWLAPAASSPAPGSEGLVKLYLSLRLPEPLQLWVRISATPVDADTVRCEAHFLDKDPEFDEWMTRTLFRYHRRALQARHHE